MSLALILYVLSNDTLYFSMVLGLGFAMSGIAR
jgi:hypothetical protein